MHAVFCNHVPCNLVPSFSVTDRKLARPWEQGLLQSGSLCLKFCKVACSFALLNLAMTAISLTDWLICFIFSLSPFFLMIQPYCYMDSCINQLLYTKWNILQRAQWHSSENCKAWFDCKGFEKCNTAERMHRDNRRRLGTSEPTMMNNSLRVR